MIDADLAARFDALEERAAHQEIAIADLNDVIAAQWREIDGLKREVSRLRDELQNAEPRRDGPEPPPPHY